MNHELAIIIPAYKNLFFDQTLESLSRQTCLNFTVYIGDDCSPNELHPIVEKYTDLLDIVYHRFDENLGSTNLIAQWNRCLALMKGEKYFCFFSDDDLMTPDCIQNFYQELETGKPADVYHFDIDIIDSDGNLKSECAKYPPILTSSVFFRLLYTYQIDARMPEFIFRTEHFLAQGGFVEFDLAYRSDNATVMLNAAAKGIHTIPVAKVRWRDSGLNVSSKKDDSLAVRKAMATVAFFNWIDCYYTNLNEQCPLSIRERFRLVCGEILELDFLSNKKLYDIFKKMHIREGYWSRIHYKIRFIKRLYKKRKLTNA